MEKDTSDLWRHCTTLAGHSEANNETEQNHAPPPSERRYCAAQVVQPLRGAHGFKETGRYTTEAAMGPKKLGVRLAAFPFLGESAPFVRLFFFFLHLPSLCGFFVWFCSSICIWVLRKMAVAVVRRLLSSVFLFFLHPFDTGEMGEVLVREDATSPKC